MNPIAITWKRRESEEAESPLPEKVPPILWPYLNQRGCKSFEDIQKLLSPSFKELNDPYKIKNMSKAVDRLFLAFENNETLALYGDFDLDGTSGLALAIKGFKDLGFENILSYQPKRLSEGYGVHPHAVEELKAEGMDLLLTIDVGITAFEAVEKANQLGVDVIISDHHLAKSELPQALAIVNPNQDEDDSNLNHLCGTGVVFYILLALGARFKEKKIKSNFSPKNLLDCFAIGTITDMVPLIRENRVLVKHGLKVLEQTKRPALRALMTKLNLFNRTLSTADVAIGLAPKLNALSRLEMGLLPLDIYIESSETKADILVNEVLKLNKKRKELQNLAEEDAIRKAPHQAIKGYSWVWSENFHKGVIGLVATKLCGTFGVPSFVGTETDSGLIIGSARLPEGSSFHLLDIFEMSDVIAQYGGHRMAAGFKIDKEHALTFEQELRGYFQNHPDSKEPKNEYIYDIEARVEDLNQNFMKWLDALEPFGVGFPLPQILLKEALVFNIKELNGGHLKLSLKGDNASINALYFSPPEKLDIATGNKINLIGELHWNYFNGNKNLQFLIKTLKPSDESASIN